jgi:hypothetical protein
MFTIAVLIIVLPLALFVGIGVGIAQHWNPKPIAPTSVNNARITQQLNQYQRQYRDYLELYAMLEKQYAEAKTDSKRCSLYRQLITTQNKIDSVNDKRQRLLDLYDIVE